MTLKERKVNGWKWREEGRRMWLKEKMDIVYRRISNKAL